MKDYKDCKDDRTWDDVIKSKTCVMFFKRGCTGAAIGRGLCAKHYSIAWRAVRSGKVTWELLEQRFKAALRKYSSFKTDFED